MTRYRWRALSVSRTGGPWPGKLEAENELTATGGDYHETWSESKESVCRRIGESIAPAFRAAGCLEWELVLAFSDGTMFTVKPLVGFEVTGV